MRRYAGGCHCGAVTFVFDSPVIARGCRCNCSICRRRNAVMSDDYLDPERIQVQGLEHLNCYRFGDRLVNHYFCRHCGIYPFHDSPERPGHYRINLGCVEEIDLESLEIRLIDGRAF